MPATLRVIGGQNTDYTYRIPEGGSAEIGRSSSADIRVPGEDASRKHCRLEHGDGGWTLTDLKSLNGTFVNKERITEKHLRPGDKIRVGGTIYEFAIERPAEDEAPPHLAAGDTGVEAAARPPDVCAQCGRELAGNAHEVGDATEIGGRLFCRRCVVPHTAGPDESAHDAPASPGDDTSGSSELGSLLESLARATGTAQQSEAEPPAADDAPPDQERPGDGLADRLRGGTPDDA